MRQTWSSCLAAISLKARARSRNYISPGRTMNNSSSSRIVSRIAGGTVGRIADRIGLRIAGRTVGRIVGRIVSRIVSRIVIISYK